MSVDSRVRIIALLAGGQVDEILGTPESEWVDFKTAGLNGPYDLSTDKGKFELAKDVAAFANAGGGLIVCGFKAKRRPSDLHEAAQKATPFAKSLVNTDTYKDVITEYVRPLIDVAFHWFNDATSPDLGYFVVEVQAVPESARWALVTRTLSEDGRLVKGGVAIPRRHGDKTPYLTSDEVYQLVNAGQRRTPEIEVALETEDGSGVSVQVSDGLIEQLLESRRRRLLESLPPRQRDEGLPSRRRGGVPVSDTQLQSFIAMQQRMRDIAESVGPYVLSQDNRTPQEYRNAVNAHIDRCRRLLPSMLSGAVASQNAPLRLRLDNRSGSMLKAVQVTATMDPEFKAAVWSSDAAADLNALPWPEPPAPYGTLTPLASMGLVESRLPSDLPSLGGSRHPRPKRPVIQKTDDGLVIEFPPVDLRAYAQVTLDSMLLYRATTSDTETAAVRWTATCTNLDGRQTETLQIPVRSLVVRLSPDTENLDLVVE
ncbi:helix-turn-helix domain-containing protein [Streptomyces sp. NPDC001422]|uniref:AlbA family DNA-binding domain-containing protein n=1 Tax=Streptomyces sp. NPDC001422 TaxID=3364575 RepID=UPI0036C4DBD1